MNITTSLVGLAVGIVLVGLTSRESWTDRLGVLVLLATGISIQDGFIGDKVREGVANLARWVADQQWDAVGPEIVALIPAIVALFAIAVTALALWHGQAEVLAVIAATLLPTLLLSVGDGDMWELLGQSWTALMSLAEMLTNWLANDLGRVVTHG